METEIAVHEGADDAHVRTFLDTQWLAVDLEPWTRPWTSGKCIITGNGAGH